MFLNGSTQTEEAQYCWVMNSTIARLVRTRVPQMIITVGSADLTSLAQLAETVSPLLLTPVYSALLPLILSSCEEGLTHTNMVSSSQARYWSLSLTISLSVSVSSHTAGTGGSHGQSGPALTDLLSAGPQ